MAAILYSFVFATTVFALSPFDPQSKASSVDNPCVPCNPKGSTGAAPPAFGSDLSQLYVDVLASVKGISFHKRDVAPRNTGFCCPKSLSCVNVQNLNIAMCYDQFTTNFGFADGSYGSLTTGEYTSGSSKANLLTGDYDAGGQHGNIYANKPADKPNTSTLSIPPQYTASGVGGAIPPNQLGSVITITTVVSGRTFSVPTTIPQTVQTNTVSGQTFTTTIPPQTISQPTIIPPSTYTSTITQTSAPPPSQGTAGSITVVGETKRLGLCMLGLLLFVLM